MEDKEVSLCDKCSNQVNIEAVYEKDKSIRKLEKCIYNFEIYVGNGCKNVSHSLIIIKTCSFYRKNIDKKLLSNKEQEDYEISSENQEIIGRSKDEMISVKQGSRRFSIPRSKTTYKDR